MTTFVDNHVEQGLSRLIDQYRKKPKIRGLLTSILQSIQELEDVIKTFHDQGLFEHAEGVWIDLLGKRIGQRRNWLEDEDYKRWIGIRSRINRSFGTPTDILEVLNLFTEYNYEYSEIRYNRGFFIRFTDVPLIDDDPLFFDDVVKAVYQTRRAGVPSAIVFPSKNESGLKTFKFTHLLSGSPLLNPGHASRGFTCVDDLTIGGRLSHVRSVG